MNIWKSKMNIISIVLIMACLSSACTIQKQNLTQTDSTKAYKNAIKDAENAEPHEISRNLVAIVPANNKLMWKKKGGDQETSLLVVTWTNYNGYDDKIGQRVEVAREIWVTTVPEVRNFCKNLKANKTLRLEQLLGLPPNAGKTKFVEMWVKPKDMFRPSADPEISDSEAEIDFRIPNDFVKISDDYIKWFNNLKMNSYGNEGYPWTRLGYTYDWGNDDNHVGLSEFVIIKGSTIEINSISSESQYCQ
ncbi:MAG: hypothetical protein ABFD75_07720 [Smithella sp.]